MLLLLLLYALLLQVDAGTQLTNPVGCRMNSSTTARPNGYMVGLAQQAPAMPMLIHPPHSLALP